MSFYQATRPKCKIGSFFTCFYVLMRTVVVIAVRQCQSNGMILPLLFTDTLLAKTKNRSFFGKVQCNLNFPDELKLNFTNFPPIFKH